MWILVKREAEREPIPIQIADLNYDILGAHNKLYVLSQVLHKQIEIYHRVSGEEEQICLYNTEYREFITENGFGECNLENFWNDCVVELIKEYNDNIRWTSAS